jgi:hypothetical protein
VYFRVRLTLRYLGIPLSVSKLPRSSWQQLIDRVADKLLVWKGALMHKSGRLTFSDLFTEVADEPAAEKPADEKKGGSNDRGEYLLFPFFLMYCKYMNTY